MKSISENQDIMQNTQTIDSEFEYFISVNRKLLALAGCLTFDAGPPTSRGKFISKCFLTWNIIASSSILSLQMYTIIRCWADFDVVAVMQVIGPFIPAVAGCLKLLLLLYHRSELYELMDRCHFYWKYTETPEDREILRKFAGSGRKRSIILSMIILVTVFLFEASGIYQNLFISVNETVTLIVGVAVTFDRDSNVYPFVVTYEFIATMMIGINLICNTIQQTFMLHGCAHFRLLQSWLGKLNQQELEKKIILDHKEIEKNTRMNLQHHQNILSYCQLLDDSFTWIIFIEVLSTAYNICFAGFNVMNSNTTIDAIKNSSSLVHVMLQMWLYCWPATELSTESTAVAEAAYQDFGWILTRKSIKSCILILIARAQKPVLMTALHFSALSLELFASAVSNAFSVYMVLRSFI